MQYQYINIKMNNNGKSEKYVYIILGILVIYLFLFSPLAFEYACDYHSWGCVSFFMVSFDIFSHIIKAVGGNMFISPHLLICIYNSSKVFPHASLTCCSTQHALFIVWMGAPPPPSPHHK